MTRNDYIEGRCTHDEFYEAVAKAAGVTRVSDELQQLANAAWANGDEHLNTIPLGVWDAAAAGRQLCITTALKKFGDHWSMMGGVCVMKHVAKRFAQLVERGTRKKPHGN